MRQNILEIALRELNYQIANEVGFPRAFYVVSQGLELTKEECNQLKSNYDNQGVR